MAARPSIRENTVSRGDAARWGGDKRKWREKVRVCVCMCSLLRSRRTGEHLVKEGGDWEQRSGGG